MAIIGRKSKGVLLFTLLKYVEVAITALTTFLLAKKIGPAQIGLAMPVLLYITYANYLSLGINQVVIKNFSRLETEGRESLLTINFQYLVLVSLINVFLAHLLLDLKFAFLASLVSIGSMMRSYFMAYYRVVERIVVLNVNNLVFSLLLLLFTLILTSDFSDYLFYWALSFGIALLFYFFSDVSFFGKITTGILKPPAKKQMTFVFSEGVKLAIAGFISTILLTSDRLIINQMNLNLELKGSYQLADYSGTAYYLFFTTVLFFFYPSLIRKLRENLSFRRIYLKWLKLVLIALPFLFIAIYGVGLVVAKYIFPEYPQLGLLILVSIILKTSVILINLLTTLYIALDQEIKYIKSMIFSLISYCMVAMFFILNKSIPILFIPLALSIILFTDFVIKLFRFERK